MTKRLGNCSGRVKALFPALLLGVSGAVMAVAPQAQAQTCGVYSLPPQLAQSNPGTFTLSVRSGDVSCQQARQVMDDDMAGKGTKTARNASTVDGWNCVGNPAGVYSETGVLSYCESPSNARIEITK
jgi:hypothetical protein